MRLELREWVLKNLEDVFVMLEILDVKENDGIVTSDLKRRMTRSTGKPLGRSKFYDFVNDSVDFGLVEHESKNGKKLLRVTETGKKVKPQLKGFLEFDVK